MTRLLFVCVRECKDAEMFKIIIINLLSFFLSHKPNFLVIFPPLVHVVCAELMVDRNPWEVSAC